jgi:hypothetical protein
MLLLPAMPAAPTGSGSYPPPLSGDWMITEDTYIANETIYLNGNISVQHCNLTLDMVWLRGNVSGGALTVTVDANSSFTARFCRVDAGNSASLTFDLNGTVQIVNSIFQSQSGENLFLIRSNATIRNCDIEGSLAVSDMAQPTMNGTIIGNTSIGATLGKNATLSGATFRNCSWGVMGGPGSRISGCNFEKCGSGILLSDNTTVINCSFRNCSAGILASTGARISKNNNISSCGFVNCLLGISSGPGMVILD